MKSKKVFAIALTIALIISTYFSMLPGLNIEPATKANAVEYLTKYSGIPLSNCFVYAQLDHTDYDSANQRMRIGGWGAFNVPSGVTVSKWVWSIDNGASYYVDETVTNRSDATSVAQSLGGNLNPTVGFDFYADLTKIKNLTSGTYQIRFGVWLSNNTISWAQNSGKTIPAVSFTQVAPPSDTLVFVDDPDIKTDAAGRKYYRDGNGTKYYFETDASGNLLTKTGTSAIKYVVDFNETQPISGVSIGTEFSAHGYAGKLVGKFGYNSVLKLGDYDLSLYDHVNVYVGSDSNFPGDSVKLDANNNVVADQGGIGAYLTLKSQGITAGYNTMPKDDTATIAEAYLPGASSGSLNLSGLATGSWGSHERKVGISVASSTYNGPVFLCPYQPKAYHVKNAQTMGFEHIIAKVEFVTTATPTCYYYNVATSETLTPNVISVKNANIARGEVAQFKLSKDGYIKILRNNTSVTENTKVYDIIQAQAGVWTNVPTANLPATTLVAGAYTTPDEFDPDSTVKFTLTAHKGFKACLDFSNGESNGNIFTSMYSDGKTNLMENGKVNIRGWFTAEYPVVGYVYSIDSMATWHELETTMIFARNITSSTSAYYANADTAGYDLTTPDLRNEMCGNYRIYIAAVLSTGEKITFYKRAINVTVDGEINVANPSSGSTVSIANSSVQSYSSNFVSLTKTDQYIGSTDRYYPTTVTLQWNYNGNPLYYIVTIADNPDFENAAYIKTTGKSVELEDLYTGATYSWKVTAVFSDHQIESHRFGFMTQWAVRAVRFDGVSNSRDAGGYDTTFGIKTKEGMIYRASAIDTNLSKWGYNGISADSTNKLINKFGVQCELDLRQNGGSSFVSSMPRYIAVSAPYYYPGITTASYKAALTTEVKSYADPQNYPMIFHCSVGRDRTGTIAFIINAICGVSEKNLRLDYEFSTFSTSGNTENFTSYKTFINNFDTLINYFNGYSSGTFQENVVKWVKDYLGVTDEEINNIRELMLSDGSLQPTHPIPSNYMTVKTSGATFVETDVVFSNENKVIEKSENGKFTVLPGASAADIAESGRAVEGKRGGTLKNTAGQTVTSGNLATGYTITFDDHTSYGIIVLGDIEGDGEVNVTDGIALLKNVINGDKSYPVFAHQDLDNDGEYGVKDALYLVKHILNGDCYPLAVSDEEIPDNKKVEIYQLAPEDDSLMMSYVIKTQNDKIVVIDGGIDGEGLDKDPYIMNAIRAILGKSASDPVEIEAWFLTHEHRDHYNELAKNLNAYTTSSNYEIKNFYFDFPEIGTEWDSVNGSGDYTPDSLNYLKAGFNNYFTKRGETAPTGASSSYFYDQLNGAVINPQAIADGLTIEIDGLAFDILQTWSVNDLVVNSTSVISRLRYNEHSMLILGDAYVDAGTRLLNTYGADALKSEYIQMAHHGQAGCDQAFYNAIDATHSKRLWPTPWWVWDIGNRNLATNQTRMWCGLPANAGDVNTLGFTDFVAGEYKYYPTTPTSISSWTKSVLDGQKIIVW